MLRVDDGVRTVLATDPRRASFPATSHAVVDAVSTWVPGTDVIVTFVVFDHERKVRILSVQDVPR